MGIGKNMAEFPFAKKSLGQHWLRDEATLQTICALADLQPTDTVLEIGPGQGSLTQLLVTEARSVVAVELDGELAAVLPAIVGVDNLEVVHQNILEFDLTRLPPDYKVAANIPYYLTGRLIKNLSNTANPPQLVVLLVQKEVAERLAAKPGQLSVLGVTAQFYWQVDLKTVVPRSLFTPPPKVDSQIVVLKRRIPYLLTVDPEAFFRLVKVGFSARRKTLNNSLSSGLRVDKTVVAGILNELKLDPNIRPQMLSLDNWYELYKLMNAKNLV
jgi:16S rRNA (adenine1518-N6/adenine1519-N6)-dimethyltransferase